MLFGKRKRAVRDGDLADLGVAVDVGKLAVDSHYEVSVAEQGRELDWKRIAVTTGTFGGNRMTAWFGVSNIRYWTRKEPAAEEGRNPSRSVSRREPLDALARALLSSLVVGQPFKLFPFLSPNPEIPYPIGD